MRALCLMLAFVAACHKRAPMQPYYGTYPQAYPQSYAAGGVFGGTWVAQGGTVSLAEQNGQVTGTIQSTMLQGSVQGVSRGNQLDFLLTMADGSSGRFAAYTDGTQLVINVGLQRLAFVRSAPPAQVGYAPAAPPPAAPPPAAPPPAAPPAERSASRPERSASRSPERGQVGLVTGCFRSSSGSGAVWVERTLYFDGAGRFSKHGAVAAQTSGASASSETRGDGGTYSVQSGKRVRLSWNDGTTATYDLVYEHGALGALQSGTTWYLRCT